MNALEMRKYTERKPRMAREIWISKAAKTTVTPMKFTVISRKLLIHIRMTRFMPSLPFCSRFILFPEFSFSCQDRSSRKRCRRVAICASRQIYSASRNPTIFAVCRPDTWMRCATPANPMSCQTGSKDCPRSYPPRYEMICAKARGGYSRAISPVSLAHVTKRKRHL